MKTEKLSGYTAILSAGSITAKDADGNTAGIVRGVARFSDAPARVQFDHARSIRAAGIWGNTLNPGLYSALVIEGGRPVLLYSDKRDADHARYFSEDARSVAAYEDRRAVLEKCAAAGVAVVHCAAVVVSEKRR